MENKIVAQQGGRVAGVARKEIETRHKKSGDIFAIEFDGFIKQATYDKRLEIIE